MLSNNDRSRRMRTDLYSKINHGGMVRVKAWLALWVQVGSRENEKSYWNNEIRQLLPRNLQ